MKRNVLLLLTVFVSLVALSMIIGVLQNAKKEQIAQIQQLLIQEATAHYKTIKELRIWHDKFGGVFQEGESDQEYHFNIYSLKPKNDHNQAVGFVKHALDYLRYHPKESIHYHFSPDKDRFSFVGVLYTQPRCITCHTDFTVGEIRGGIEVNLPLTKYKDSLRSIDHQFKLLYWLVIAVHLIGTGVLLYAIYNFFASEDRLRELNTDLDQKVSERTQEIQALYTQEHYHKQLLQTITELNESLIKTYSMGSIIETSIEILRHHPHYKLILFGHFDGKIFHQRYISGDTYGIFTEEYLVLEEMRRDPYYDVITGAIVNRHWSIQNTCHFEYLGSDLKIESEHRLHAGIAFPLVYDENHGCDILSIWTNREEGFDPEEISILDMAVHDITLSLNLYKQRKINENALKR